MKKVSFNPYALFSKCSFLIGILQQLWNLLNKDVKKQHFDKVFFSSLIHLVYGAVGNLCMRISRKLLKTPKPVSIIISR